MLTAGTTLAIFFMLGISSLSLFWSKKINIPHTVLLVLIGVGLGLLANISFFGFFHELKLTPELLFYLFLPILIFESAYNINVRHLVSDGGIILSIAVGSFLLSSTIIATLLHFALSLIGIDIPFLITLLFGSLISATDPVAVLALFKEYGVPKRLSLIFEGESLFNDATAVALFLIVLEGINQGGIDLLSSMSGIITFISMLIMGVLFGLAIGSIFTYLIGSAKNNEISGITLTIVLAHITFILAEIISTYSFFGAFSVPISPIISTTIASLLVGNYGRIKLGYHSESFVSHLWEQFAFMTNSLIFILIGILMVNVNFLNPIVIISVAITVLIVAISRAVSIYPIISIYNLFHQNNKIPSSWQHLLAWGSLRGALAVTMVFLIPDDLSITGWELEISPKEFILAITIGCIAATLFIKATSIKKLVKNFKLDKLTALEEVGYQETKALMHHKVTEQLTKYKDRGYIDSDNAQNLLIEHENAFRYACNKVNTLSEDNKNKLTFRILRIFAIGIETHYLKNLYENQEITESVFRRIEGKLRLQLEAMENGNLSPDVSLHGDGRDIFDSFFSVLRKFFNPKEESQTFEEKYMYYRAQGIISRKVLKEIELLKNTSSIIFTSSAVAHVTKLYTTFKENSEAKLFITSQTDTTASQKLAINLAEKSVNTIEKNVLKEAFNNQLITQKLYIILKNEIEANNLI